MFRNANLKSSYIYLKGYALSECTGYLTKEKFFFINEGVFFIRGLVEKLKLNVIFKETSTLKIHIGNVGLLGFLTLKFIKVLNLMLGGLTTHIATFQEDPYADTFARKITFLRKLQVWKLRFLKEGSILNASYKLFFYYISSNINPKNYTTINLK